MTIYSVWSGCMTESACRSGGCIGKCPIPGSPLGVPPVQSARDDGPHPQWLIEGSRVTRVGSARDRAESNCCGKAAGSCSDCPLIIQPTGYQPAEVAAPLIVKRTSHQVENNLPATESPANPKEIFGDKKLPLYLVPFTIVAHLSVALFEGMKKYGLVNWRGNPIEAMTYASGAKRHIDAWIGGQRCDPKTKVHHIASMMANGAIILDAEVHGTLIDNRPLPIAQDKIDALIVELEATLDNLRKLHADKDPKHFTIADKPAGV